MGFINQKKPNSETTTTSTTDVDASNPWSRDTIIGTSNWQAGAATSSSILDSTNFNHVDLIGHQDQSDNDDEDLGEEVDETEVTQQGRGPKQYVWENDLDVKECRGCRRKFGFLNRRHHCRCCGLIHCDKCSMSRAYLEPSQILQDPNGPFESPESLSSRHMRVCDYCFAKLSGLPP